MKKSSHTNKTDAHTGLLFMWHSEDITSSAVPRRSYIIYLLTTHRKHIFGPMVLIKKLGFAVEKDEVKY